MYNKVYRKDISERTIKKKHEINTRYLYLLYFLFSLENNIKKQQDNASKGIYIGFKNLLLISCLMSGILSGTQFRFGKLYLLILFS